MSEVIFISGATTGVGKTWTAALLIEALRNRGFSVYASKPVQSFEPGDELTDAHVLAAASGQSPEEVCPLDRWLPAAMAPPMAAEKLGREPFTVAQLVAETTVRPGAITIVEGVGGPRSPVCADGDNVALSEALGSGLVVVVVDAALGAVNAALVTVSQFSVAPSVVFLNHFDVTQEVHRLNARWLSENGGLTVTTNVEDLTLSVAERVKPQVEVG